jgi:ABC-2 type transport system permease protein
MKSLARVFRYELRRQVRRTGYLLVTIGIPIIALVIFYGIRLYQQSRQGSTSDTAAAQGMDAGPNSRAKINLAPRPSGVVDRSGLLEPSRFSNLLTFKTEDQAGAALRDNRIGAYYLIAPDYLQSGKVDMYFDRFNTGNVDNSALRMLIVQSLVAKSGKPIEPGLIARLQAREPQFTVHNLTETGKVNQAAGEGVSFAMVNVFGMMLLFSAFTTSAYLMQSVVEEKESRMVEVLMSSMRPVDLLAGKILALGLLGLTQMILWGATAVYIIRQIVPLDPSLVGLNITNEQLAVLSIYFVLGYLFFACVYASIGALSSNMREGPQLAGFATLPAVVPLMAATIFASAPNGPLATGLSIFPVTAPLGMVMRVAVSQDVPPVQIVISVILLALTVVFMMWLAGRLFRVNTLLSGQVPRLRDLPRLVRERA